MTSDQKMLYAGRSDYGTYKIIETVYDGRPARVLYGDRGSPQSGVALDDNPELLFDYNQRFLEMIASVRPKRVLVIGGGVMMLPAAAHQRFPNMSIDVVEIDPLLIELARDYFTLPIDRRFGVHAEDGKAFLERTDQKYDMIILDAFSGYDIPHHLLERDAALLYKRRLRRGGFVAINFISEFMTTRRRLAHELTATFGEAFPSLELYQADPHYPKRDEQNLLLVAGSTPLHFDYLQSDAVTHLMPLS